MSNDNSLLEMLPSQEKLVTGLLVCAGGFEMRSVSFPKRLQTIGCDAERVAIIRYTSQSRDNEPNFDRVRNIIGQVTRQPSEVIDVDAMKPVISYEHIKEHVLSAAQKVSRRKATIDISGMTHMWALGVIHACVTEGFEVNVIYTEADRYFPLKRQGKPLLKAWRERDYDSAQRLLQSASIMAVHVLPDFAGNLRPGHPICLIVFVGYEPNRIEGLVDRYAPGSLVVLYGKSPRPEHEWRTELSRELHQEMFSNWRRREDECTTFWPEDTIAKLEEVFSTVAVKYDVAVAPHCSKMQGVASYIFWRRHPETQLIFTSPVRFKPSQYSTGERATYVYHLTAALRR